RIGPGAVSRDTPNSVLSVAEPGVSVSGGPAATIHVPSVPDTPRIAARAGPSNTPCTVSWSRPITIDGWDVVPDVDTGPHVAPGNGPGRNCAAGTWSSAPYPGSGDAAVQPQIAMNKSRASDPSR